METSNSPDLAESATTETASPVENSTPTTETPSAAAPNETPQHATVKDAILSRKGKEGEVTPPTPPAKEGEAPVTPAAAQPQAPAYQPNYKFKAFGKEREVPELFRGLIKDAETEKQIKDVFTQVDAFQDMKGRYEHVSQQHQQVLNDFTALDRDVKRVTGFLNKRDLDNFFASVRLSDQEILQYLQTKAAAMQDPNLKAQYQNQVQMRSQAIERDEQLEQLRSDRQNLAVQARTMQLDSVLSRPDVSSVASAWDTTAGELGAFRNLVIREAAAYAAHSQQDISAEQAVQLVLQRYGKFVQTAPQAQVAPMVQAQAQPGVETPQATQPQVVPQAKPTIPTLNGKGTSPVKQVPKSLDDLKRLSKEAQKAAMSSY